MSSHQSKYSLGLISLLLCGFSFAYEIDINAKRFRHITSTDGLSSNNIISIVQDSRGYIWFGTANGLNQYDGYNFKVYRANDNVKNSLSSSMVTDLIEDSKGNIWIATANGLNKYDYGKNQFSYYLYNKDKINIHIIRTLVISGETLWVGGGEGLYQINTDNGALSKTSSDHNIFRMIADADNGLWLATEKNLVHYDMKLGVTTEYEMPFSGPIWSLFKDKNILWLGTHNGIQWFNLTSGEFVKDRSMLTGMGISDFKKDNNDQLWIGTFSKGLFKYSLENETLEMVDRERNDPFFYSSPVVRKLYFDARNNTLWVGSLEGVYYVNINNSSHVLRTSNKKLVSNTVFSIAMDQLNNVWVGTSKGGTVLRGEDSKSYDLGYAVSIRIIGSEIWAVSDHGAFIYDSKRDRFVNVNDKVPSIKGMNMKLIYDIAKINKNTYILAGLNGFIIWNRDKETSSILKIECSNTKLCNQIMAFYSNDDGVIVSTMYGLYFFNPETQSIERYLKSPELTILDGSEVYYTTSDTHNNVWAATGSGLFKLHDREIINRYTEDHGLSNNFVWSVVITEDRLWISSDFGLDLFNIKDNSFEKIYLNNDNFKQEFTNNSVFKSDDNILYFGGVEGVLYFDPKEYIKTASLPKTRITEFHLFNQIQKAGSELLSQAIEYADRLVLNHDQNMLTFEFSSMNYLNPDHLYAFQMKGVTGDDDHWLYTDAKNRRATFTPPPGDYIFRVKSGWDENTWSDEVTELKVSILPPWWATPYAYSVYLLLLTLGVISIIKMRTFHLRKQAEKLKQEVAEQTNEVQGLLEKKNELFANVSHELRTPLTLIIDPIKRLIQECKSMHQKENLLLVERNSQRLLHMVDQLLNVSRMAAPVKSKQKAHDLSLMVNLLVDSMRGLVDKKRLQLLLNCQDDVFVGLNNDDLETVVLNILTNAIKYTDDGGQIKITLTKNHQQAQLIISDTGIGIKPEHYDLIFQRFGRVYNEGNRNIPGTGIGLALVKEVLDQYQGRIELNSELGKGSEFTIFLPLVEPSDAVAATQLSSSSHSEVLYIQERLNEDMRQLDPQNMQAVDHRELSQLLIVEDTKDMRDYLFTALSEYYPCLTAFDGEQGFKQAKKHLPDLIICDVMMPGMDGFELLRAIRNNDQTSHIPLILLTAKIGKESQLKGLDHLADDYITKPFDLEILQSRIMNLLAGRKLLREHYARQFMQSEHPHINFQAALAKDKQIFLQKFHRLIEKNFHHHDFTVDDMATAMHMSSRTLLQKLKSIIDQSPKEYLILYRLKAAAKLLIETTLSIREVQDRVGFSSASHFAYSFRLHFKLTPKDYRHRSCITD